MSLLDQYAVPCVRLARVRQDDAVGGYTEPWRETGNPFNVSWEFVSAPEMTVAEQRGVSRVYRLYVPKSLELAFHDVFRRMDSGQTYRVTNPGTDRVTPASSNLDRRLIEAEEYDLPREVEA